MGQQRGKTTPDSNTGSYAPHERPEGEVQLGADEAESDGVGAVEIYQSSDGSVSLNVKTDGETVWLTVQQIATLFGRERSTVSKHIANARREELAEIPTVENFATVQTEGPRSIQRGVDHYNLDVVLSVGYRVKSAEGVRFRQWANDVLKRYVIAGVAKNEARLRDIADVANVLERSEDATLIGIAEVLRHYSPALHLLDGYDRGEFDTPQGTAPSVRLDYKDARSVVDEVARHFPDDKYLGIEKDDSIRGILESVEQTFAGQALYPSVQEKAAHLLYFTVKDHPFKDGNKRSAAALFTYYLSRNGALYGGNGNELVSTNALTAITLMTAMSKPAEKETIIRLVTNMLNAGAEDA